MSYIYLGDVCFLEAKIHWICGPSLQPCAAEMVDQMIAVCNKTHVCFLTSTGYNNTLKFKQIDFINWK